MRLCFLLVRRVPPVMSPVLAEVFRILERHGFRVETTILEEVVSDPSSIAPTRHELYILKSHTELSLSIAGILHARGARLLNPYPCCAAAQNKIMAHQRLRHAGVTVPDSWVTGDLRCLRSTAERTPLIIKPYLGHRGEGIHVVRAPDDLDRIPVPRTPVLVQEYVKGSGQDLKIYVVGEEVFAVRKPFSPTSFTRPGVPCEVSDEVRDLALRCGRAFGLGLYGIDVLEGPDGPVVVDLNYFPGYKGVPRPAPLIADYIEGYAVLEHELELPSLALETPDPAWTGEQAILSIRA